MDPLTESMDADVADIDLNAQTLLLAACQHDLPTLRDLLKHTSANVQDPGTGFTPLHAAIAACAPPDDSDDSDSDSDEEAGGLSLKPTLNGHANGSASPAALSDTGSEAPPPAVDKAKRKEEKRKQELSATVQTVKLLFQNGAIWNDLDVAGETPGCLALRLGLRELYEIIVDAGVRAELLLNRLDEYQLLGDGDESDEEKDKAGEKAEEPVVTDTDASAHGGLTPAIVIENTEPESSSTEPAQPHHRPPPTASTPLEEVNSEDYLHSTLTFTPDRLLDSSQNGVMMSWETSIMRRSAELLCPTPGLRVLNVGHGMGIIDGIFQSLGPTAHHIIEAHPQVLDSMKENGWYDKPGVVVHGGKWQDVLPKIVGDNIIFDAIYFDTFAEDYKALREFFSEYVIGLLDPQGGSDGQGGRFGFFNGLGADRQVCYDVYTKVVEMDLFEAGFDTEWEEIKVPDLTGEWSGVRRRYWTLESYRLPTCRFMG